MAKAKAALSLEERLERALVPEFNQPYPVPGNWCWTTVGTIGEVKGGKRLPSGHNLVGYKTNHAYLRVTDFSETDIQLQNIKYITDTTFSKISNYTISKKDIYISIAGTIGRVGIIQDILDGSNLTENAAKITNLKINQKYLLWLLLSTNVQMQMGESTKTTTQAKLALFRIEEISIPIPPLTEQQRIVNRIESLFAKLDEAKEKAQAALDSFETRKAAILHKAFTGELTAKWREENGLGMDSWKTFELHQICTVNPKKTDTKNLPDDLKVSFFSMASLSEIYGEITAPQIRNLKEVRSGYTNFLEGDVVFAKITPCMENGKSAIIGELVNGVGYGTTEFYVLRCGKELFNRFLYHIVRNRTFRYEAQAVMSGAVGQQRVPKEFMEKYLIHLPSKSEQIEIVRLLDNFFAKEQKAKELCSVLDKIDLIKKSILARAFRGELDTNDPTEESALELLKSIV